MNSYFQVIKSILQKQGAFFMQSMKHFDLNLLISKGGSTAIIAEKYYDGN